MGMTSLREAGEKQHLRQLFGLFMRNLATTTNVAGNVWKWNLIGCTADRTVSCVAVPGTVVPGMI